MLCTLLLISLRLKLTSAAYNNHNHNHNHNTINYCQISFDPNGNSFQVENESESIIYSNNNNHNNYDTVNHETKESNNPTTATTTTEVSNNSATIMTNPVMFYHHHLDNQEQQQQQHVSFVSYVQDTYDSIQELLLEEYFDNEDEDDDDDDDDQDDNDDGHSSMLSNASIRKRVLAGVTTTSSMNSYGGDGDRGYYVNSNKNNVRKNYNNGGYYNHYTREMKNAKREQSLKLSSLSSSNTKNLKNLQKKSPSSSFGLHQALTVRGGSGTTIATKASDEFIKRLIAAATITALYEGLIGHILEFLKIAMQTAPRNQNITYFTILKTITQQKGLLALWDGFIPWGFIQAVCKGGVFGLAHAMAKTYLKPLIDNGMIPPQVGLTLAGGIAGGFQGFVLSPLLLLKTRVMTNPVFREKMSVWKTTLLSLTIGLDVVKNEGILALMKGADVFALKRVFDWSTRYYFSDLFELMMLKYGAGINGRLSPGEKIVASLLSGYASTLLTLPLDVIVAKAQDAKKAGVKVSAWNTFIQDYKDGGLKGLYDANMMGFEARLLHVCLTTVVMQTGSPIMFDLLFGKK